MRDQAARRLHGDSHNTLGAATAASAGNVRKQPPELRGKSPLVAFVDCDLDAAADGVIKAATIDMGECCIAGSRLLVEARIAEAFESRLAERLHHLRMGDPMDPSSRVGAIINQAQFDRTAVLVRDGLRDGVRIVCGGDPETHPGLCYPSTVLADVTPDFPVARQEIFGPVLAVIPFQGLDQAIRLANDPDHGLCGIEEDTKLRAVHLHLGHQPERRVDGA